MNFLEAVEQMQKGKSIKSHLGKVFFINEYHSIDTHNVEKEVVLSELNNAWEVVEEKKTLSDKIRFTNILFDSEKLSILKLPSDAMMPIYCEEDVKEALKEFIDILDKSQLEDGMVHINYIKQEAKKIFGERLI